MFSYDESTQSYRVSFFSDDDANKTAEPHQNVDLSTEFKILHEAPCHDLWFCEYPHCDVSFWFGGKHHCRMCGNSVCETHCITNVNLSTHLLPVVVDKLPNITYPILAASKDELPKMLEFKRACLICCDKAKSIPPSEEEVLKRKKAKEEKKERKRQEKEKMLKESHWSNDSELVEKVQALKEKKYAFSRPWVPPELPSILNDEVAVAPTEAPTHADPPPIVPEPHRVAPLVRDHHRQVDAPEHSVESARPVAAPQHTGPSALIEPTTQAPAPAPAPAHVELPEPVAVPETPAPAVEHAAVASEEMAPHMTPAARVEQDCSASSQEVSDNQGNAVPLFVPLAMEEREETEEESPDTLTAHDDRPAPAPASFVPAENSQPHQEEEVAVTELPAPVSGVPEGAVDAEQAAVEPSEQTAAAPAVIVVPEVPSEEAKAEKRRRIAEQRTLAAQRVNSSRSDADSAVDAKRQRQGHIVAIEEVEERRREAMMSPAELALYRNRRHNQTAAPRRRPSHTTGEQQQQQQQHQHLQHLEQVLPAAGDRRPSDASHRRPSNASQRRPSDGSSPAGSVSGSVPHSVTVAALEIDAEAETTRAERELQQETAAMTEYMAAVADEHSALAGVASYELELSRRQQERERAHSDARRLALAEAAAIAAAELAAATATTSDVDVGIAGPGDSAAGVDRSAVVHQRTTTSARAAMSSADAADLLSKTWRGTVARRQYTALKARRQALPVPRTLLRLQCWFRTLLAKKHMLLLYARAPRLLVVEKMTVTAAQSSQQMLVHSQAGLEELDAAPAAARDVLLTKSKAVSVYTTKVISNNPECTERCVVASLPFTSGVLGVTLVNTDSFIQSVVHVDRYPALLPALRKFPKVFHKYVLAAPRDTAAAGSLPTSQARGRTVTVSAIPIESVTVPVCNAAEESLIPPNVGTMPSGSIKLRTVTFRFAPFATSHAGWVCKQANSLKGEFKRRYLVLAEGKLEYFDDALSLHLPRGTMKCAEVGTFTFGNDKSADGERTLFISDGKQEWYFRFPQEDGRSTVSEWLFKIQRACPTVPLNGSSRAVREIFRKAKEFTAPAPLPVLRPVVQRFSVVRNVLAAVTQLSTSSKTNTPATASRALSPAPATTSGTQATSRTAATADHSVSLGDGEIEHKSDAPHRRGKPPKSVTSDSEDEPAAAKPPRRKSVLHGAIKSIQHEMQVAARYAEGDQITSGPESADEKYDGDAPERKHLSVSKTAKATAKTAWKAVKNTTATTVTYLQNELAGSSDSAQEPTGADGLSASSAESADGTQGASRPRRRQSLTVTAQTTFHNLKTSATETVTYLQQEMQAASTFSSGDQVTFVPEPVPVPVYTPAPEPATASSEAVSEGVGESEGEAAARSTSPAPRRQSVSKTAKEAWKAVKSTTTSTAAYLQSGLHRTGSTEEQPAGEGAGAAAASPSNVTVDTGAEVIQENPPEATVSPKRRQSLSEAAKSTFKTLKTSAADTVTYWQLEMQATSTLSSGDQITFIPEPVPTPVAPAPAAESEPAGLASASAESEGEAAAEGAPRRAKRLSISKTAKETWKAVKSTTTSTAVYLQSGLHRTGSTEEQPGGAPASAAADEHPSSSVVDGSSSSESAAPAGGAAATMGASADSADELDQEYRAPASPKGKKRSSLSSSATAAWKAVKSTAASTVASTSALLQPARSNPQEPAAVPDASSNADAGTSADATADVPVVHPAVESSAATAAETIPTVQSVPETVHSEAAHVSHHEPLTNDVETVAVEPASATVSAPAPEVPVIAAPHGPADNTADSNAAAVNSAVDNAAGDEEASLGSLSASEDSYFAAGSHSENTQAHPAVQLFSETAAPPDQPMQERAAVADASHEAGSGVEEKSAEDEAAPAIIVAAELEPPAAFTAEPPALAPEPSQEPTSAPLAVEASATGTADNVQDESDEEEEPSAAPTATSKKSKKLGLPKAMKSMFKAARSSITALTGSRTSQQQGTASAPVDDAAPAVTKQQSQEKATPQRAAARVIAAPPRAASAPSSAQKAPTALSLALAGKQPSRAQQMLLCESEDSLAGLTNDCEDIYADLDPESEQPSYKFTAAPAAAAPVIGTRPATLYSSSPPSAPADADEQGEPTKHNEEEEVDVGNFGQESPLQMEVPVALEEEGCAVAEPASAEVVDGVLSMDEPTTSAESGAVEISVADHAQPAPLLAADALDAYTAETQVQVQEDKAVAVLPAVDDTVRAPAERAVEMPVEESVEESVGVETVPQLIAEPEAAAPVQPELESALTAAPAAPLEADSIDVSSAEATDAQDATPAVLSVESDQVAAEIPAPALPIPSHVDASAGEREPEREVEEEEVDAATAGDSGKQQGPKTDNKKKSKKKKKQNK